MNSNEKTLIIGSKEVILVLGAFMLAAFLFISFSVWATTIGTNVDSTGTLGAATSTPWGTLTVDQTATQGRIDPTFVVGDNSSTTPFIFVSPKGIVAFGTKTPSALFLAQGDVVAHSDVYVAGGLGVANATTANGDLIVGTNPIMTFMKNGRLIVGASTTAHTGGATVNKFVFDGGDATFSSGGTGTTTFSILTEAAPDGANSCIEMSSDGLTYTLMINGAGSGVLVSQGTCDN